MPESLRISYLIARREFVTRVRSRFFQVGTAVLIVFLAGYLVLQATVLNRLNNTLHVGFVGSAQALAPPLQSAVEADGRFLVVTQLGSVDEGEAEIRSGKLDAVVSGDPLAPTVTVRDQLDPTVEAVLAGLARQGTLVKALTEKGVDPGSVEAQVAAAKVQVKTLDPKASQRTARIVTGIFIAALLYTALLMYGQFVSQGVIEEKANRIVELLLSAVPARRLLIGKVIGIGLVGVLQMALIGLAVLLVTRFTKSLDLPSLDLLTVAGGIVWFVLGFLFYALLYAAGAAMVTRQEDAAAATAPITVLVLGTYLAFFWVVGNPDNPVAVTISMLPGLAPVMMPARIATGDAQAWQVLVAVVLSVAAIAGINWAAARIYTNSILQTGSRVSLRQAWSGRSR